MCMKRMLMLLILFLPMCLMANEKGYQSQVLSPRVKSLQVHLASDWQKAPVIEMGSDQQVTVSFDEMSHEYLRLAYRVLHCNADWTPSGMNELEYLEGFSENDLPEGNSSEATTVEYTHYSFSLPNEQVQLKLSGNYVLEVFDRDAEEDEALLLRACFSLLDRKVGLDAKVSAQTDQAYNDRYQQVFIEVQTPMGLISRPESDVTIMIRQNRRVDNQVLGVPLYMSTGNALHYKHQPALVFEAGNEYRRFEISSHKLPGMGVDRLDFQRPHYHAFLFADQPRLSGYTYDEDQNGRFYIRNREADFLQSDYQVVHFCLPASKPFDKPLYLLGDFVQANMPQVLPLRYNEETGAYEMELLLKQGLYNYCYALGYLSENVLPSEGYCVGAIEGDYWPTKNEYQIFVYYRPFGGQYDELIGYGEVTN